MVHMQVDKHTHTHCWKIGLLFSLTIEENPKTHIYLTAMNLYFHNTIITIVQRENNNNNNNYYYYLTADEATKEIVLV